MTVAPTLLMHPHTGRQLKRRTSKVSTSGGYASISATISIVALSLTTLRLGELFGAARFIKPVFLATIVGLAAHVLLTKSPAWSRLWHSKVFRLVLLYCFTVIASFPLSIWKGQTWSTIMVLPWAVSLVVILGLTKPALADIDRISKWMAWMTAIVAGALMTKGAVVEGTRLTSSGSYDPNDLGALFAFTLPFALAAALRGGWPSRLLSIGASVVLFSALMKTGSRGALVGLGCGLVIFLFSFRMRTIVLVLAVFVVAVPAVIPVLPQTMRDRAATLMSLDEDYNTTSNSGRVYLWKRGIVFALENPLLGLGAGTFEAQVGNDFRSQQVVGAWHTAHNTYVQVAAELGFIGLSSLLGLLLISGRDAVKLWGWKSKIHRPEYLAGLLAYMACIFFLSHAYSYILFAVFGLSILLNSFVEAPIEENSNRQRRGLHDAEARNARRSWA